MTVALTLLEDALRDAILSAGTNTRVIFFYPNAPRPEFPYTSIQHLATQEEINDWAEFDDTSDLNKQIGYRDITFTINTYGDNALQEASNIQGKIRVQTIRDTIRETLSASIMDMTAIGNLSTLVGDAFETRATFDIIMNVNLEDGSTTDDTGYFDTVEPIEWTNKP